MLVAMKSLRLTVRFGVALTALALTCQFAASPVAAQPLPPIPVAPGVLPDSAIAPLAPPPPESLAATTELPPIPPAPSGYGLPSGAPPPYALPSSASLPPGSSLAPAPPDCWDPDANLSAGRPRDFNRALRRCRRITGEMVELYISAGLFGMFSAALVAGDADDANLTLSLLVLGPFAMVGATFALDNATPLPSGLPGSIATGFAIGALEYTFVSALALGNDTFGDRSALVELWLSSLAGAVGFGLLATQLQPTRAEVALVRSGAIWGGFLGLMGALAADLEEVRPAFGLTLGAMNAGLLLAMLVSRTVPLSRNQVLLLDVCGLSGGLLGLAVGSGVSGAGGARSISSADAQLIPVAVGVGTLAGLVLGMLLGKPYPNSPEEAQARELALEVSPYVQPQLAGGFTAGVTVTM